MAKDAAGFLLWLLGGAAVLSDRSALDPPSAALLVLGLLTFGFDAVQSTRWGSTASRVAPLLALALLLSGGSGFVVASIALFSGGLLICLTGRNKAQILGDLFRSIAPLGAVAVWTLSLSRAVSELLLIIVYVVVCLLIEPRRLNLRLSTVMLLCAPWLALACHDMSSQAPLRLLLVVPILFGLSTGSDDMFPILRKLRRRLQLSQAQIKAESEKARRFHHLLWAANQMARTLKPEELKEALTQAAEGVGVKKVGVFLPGESAPKSGIPLLEGKGSLVFSGEVDQAQKDQLQILARMFGTCWENSDLHRRVLDALEETRRSQAQLVESSRLAAMGLISAGVAHEVNTPLGAIQISNELALKCLTKKPEAVPKHLEAIDLATEQARKAVERILHYARPIGDAQEETFYLSEVAVDALALLDHRIERAKSKVVAEVPSHLTLTGERQAFYTLLFNLILNALEATTPDQEGTVWLRCGETNEKIVLEVEDCGPGVPAEIREKIFEPFFTTRPSGEGTGLGLHLARTAAEHFGGRLGLMQTREHGAIFRAEFPRNSSS